jgi:enterochelin esterase-like enzyme
VKPMPSPFPNLPVESRGRVRAVDHVSRALADNPWGDPRQRDVWVYTPPGTDTTPDRRYPVILILAPFSGTGESMLARSLTDVSMATRIDRLIADGCPPFIAVMPDVLTTLVGSQFVDSPAIGAYATWLGVELRSFIDGRFRTTGDWAACGRSSGGFGALHLAMTFPGAFRAVASNAGDMGFDLAYLGEIPGGLGPIRQAGGPMACVERFWSSDRLAGSDFSAMNLLCLSAAYAPERVDQPDGFPAPLPVDWQTGVPDLDVFHGWRRLDPVVRAAEDDAAASALDRLDLLFLHAGDRDEYHLQLGARRLAAALRKRGIDHEHEEFAGTHRGTSWRFDASLPRLARALSG